MCLVPIVYCWFCETKFEKKNPEIGNIDDFENCPSCGKGFDDLSKEAKKAVLMTLKGEKEYLDQKMKEVWI